MQIDASLGEGGGQVLRTILSLATITRREVEIINIRGNRSDRGLQPPHLAAVIAASEICDATVDGAALGSTSIRFKPGVLKAGDFTFSASSNSREPASATLLYQALAPVLMYGPGRSTITISGLTHASGSPTVTYLQTVFLQTARKFGFRGDLALERWGWGPSSAGSVRATVERPVVLRGVDLSLRGELLQIGGIAVVTGTDQVSGSRQRDRALRRIAAMGKAGQISVQSVESSVPGNMLFLLVVFERSVAGFSSLAIPGRSPEKVADVALDELEEFLHAYSVIDKYLADQLIIYGALAHGETSFSTSMITPHLLSTIEVVKHFLPARIHVDGRPGQPGDVRIEGVGLSR